MVDGRCSKKYPRDYLEQTEVRRDAYPLYARPNDGRVFERDGEGRHAPNLFTNRDVVPYNAYLLAKYNCHINVEICTSVRAVKYLYKYVYKGYDKAHVRVTRAGRHEADGEQDQNVDEIQRYIDARYVSMSEGVSCITSFDYTHADACPAVWRLLAFSMNGMRPAVTRLALHEPENALFFFDDGDDAAELARRGQPRTTLTEFFAFNRRHPGRLHCTYVEAIKHLTWDPQRKLWKVRQRDTGTIGRVAWASPRQQERFYLRILLHHAIAPTCFRDVRTFTVSRTGRFRPLAWPEVC